MGRKGRLALQPTAILNEQRDNQDRSENPNDLHARKLRPFSRTSHVILDPMLSIHTRQGHQGAVYDILWSSAHQSWFSCGGDGIVAQWTMDQANGTARLHTQSACYSLTTWGDSVVIGDASGGLSRAGVPSGVMEVVGHNAPVLPFTNGPMAYFSLGMATAQWGWRMGQEGIGNKCSNARRPMWQSPSFFGPQRAHWHRLGVAVGNTDANNTLRSMTVMHQGLLLGLVARRQTSHVQRRAGRTLGRVCTECCALHHAHPSKCEVSRGHP